MKLVKTNLEGVMILEPKVFGDHRGWFTETYSKEVFEEGGVLIDFVQDNHSGRQCVECNVREIRLLVSWYQFAKSVEP